MALTRESLLAAAVETESVTLPGIGDVYLRAFTGAEFDRLRKSITDKKGGVNEQGLMARFVIAGVCDETGKPLFTGADVESVNGLPLKILMRLFKAVQDHNGIGKEDTDELLGNSDATTPNDSGTD